MITITNLLEGSVLKSLDKLSSERIITIATHVINVIKVERKNGHTSDSFLFD